MADFMVAGTRYRETFDRQDEAEAWELEARAALVLGKPVPAARNNKSDTGAALDTLGPLFEHTKRTHWENNPKIKAPDTAIASGKECVEYFGRNKLVREIDTEAMQEFARSIVESGRTYTTADRKLAALSKMLGIAFDKGVIPRKPKIPMSGETNERIRFLTKEEAQNILRVWREWHQEEIHAFTVFALHTGARLGAIMDLRWNAFGPNFNTVLFWGGDKKARGRTLPMSAPAKQAMLTMKQLYPDSRGPFQHWLGADGKPRKLRDMWERMQRHLGYDDVVVHTLRHTCASWMVQAGVDLKRVQTWLGHKRIETTLIYAKLGTGDLDACADILGGMIEPAKPKLEVVGNNGI